MQNEKVRFLSGLNYFVLKKVLCCKTFYRAGRTVSILIEPYRFCTLFVSYSLHSVRYTQSLRFLPATEAVQSLERTCRHKSLNILLQVFAKYVSACDPGSWFALLR